MHSAVRTMMKMSMSVLLLVTVLLQQLMSANALQDEQLDELWTTFKQTYNKSYTGDEDSFRKAIWAKNVDYIAAHNLKSELGLSNFTLGVNEFSDWTDDEVHKFLLGTPITVDPNNHTSPEFDPFAHVPEDANLPTSVDWRTKGYVTPVKQQGRCGSCWAFSATGALEGQHFKKTGRLVSLSEQNLVDCSRPQGNQGCNGGWPSYAFEYIRLNGGVDTEASYPYRGNDGVCRFNPSTVGARCSGYRQVTAAESSLMAAVATIGPITVAVDVTQAFYQYKQGIFYDPQCSTTSLKHAVLVVGYGTFRGHDYWIVKNSWGPGWGMSGYILMSRNRRNNCGIATVAVFPIV